MIREMTLEDADKVYEIENESFFEPWSKKSSSKNLKKTPFLSITSTKKMGKSLDFTSLAV